MNNQEVIERLKFLMKELNLRQVELARKIGIDTSNLSKYLNGRIPVSDALINRVVVNLGVSKQWLEEGTDLPFAKAATPATTLMLPATLSPGQGTPIYDLDVTAGDMPRARMFTDDRIIGWIDMPDVARDCRIIRVSGDSMTPVIRDGDYLAIRELSNTNYIYWGQIYVVLLDDYRFVKYVRRHPDESKVILRSANTNYDDIDVRRDDIREMMLVQHILHLNTML